VIVQLQASAGNPAPERADPRSARRIHPGRRACRAGHNQGKYGFQAPPRPT